MDTADVTFKHKSDTIIDLFDMNAAVSWSRILINWWNITYIVGAHLFGLWPVMSMSSQR